MCCAAPRSWPTNCIGMFTTWSASKNSLLPHLPIVGALTATWCSDTVCISYSFDFKFCGSASKQPALSKNIATVWETIFLRCTANFSVVQKIFNLGEDRNEWFQKKACPRNAKTTGASDKSMGCRVEMGRMVEKRRMAHWENEGILQWANSTVVWFVEPHYLFKWESLYAINFYGVQRLLHFLVLISS